MKLSSEIDIPPNPAGKTFLYSEVPVVSPAGLATYTPSAVLVSHPMAENAALAEKADR